VCLLSLNCPEIISPTLAMGVGGSQVLVECRGRHMQTADLRSAPSELS
jgi:hypothetical protein